MDITKITRPARKLLPLKTCGAVIVAAGSGQRLGSEIPKVLYPLAGKELIDWTLIPFGESSRVDGICIVTTKKLIPWMERKLKDIGKPFVVVSGGKDRGASVKAGLKALPEDQEPNLERCKYVGYYYFNQEGGSGWHQIEGTNWYYEGQFSPHMPDLDLGNPQVRGEIRAIMQFWIDRGVSGFRLDAVKEFYSGNIEANVEVLNWIQTAATEIREDCYLVGECWDSFGAVTQYYTSGLTSFFDFPFGNSNGKIPAVLRAAGTASTVSSYAQALQQANEAYSEANPDYIDAPFLSNHDVGRIAGFVNRDENKMKLAGAMNIFMSGSCFIYYGEEIGMPGSGNDPSKRAPMYWNAERDNGTTDPPPECELPEEYPLGSLAEQAGNEASIYNYYRQAIAIRNAMPVIARGATTAETELNVNCISAQRKTWGEEECLILMNINTEAAQVDLSAYEGWTLAASLSADGGEITLDAGTLNLPAFGTAILVPAK